MALLRHLKRRLNFVGLVLIATTLWIFYLIVSAPAATDRRFENALLPHNNAYHVKESVTRRLIIPPPPPDGVYQKPVEKQMIGPPPVVIAKEVDVDGKQAIPRPPPERDTMVYEKIKPFGNTKKGDKSKSIGVFNGDTAKRTDEAEHAQVKDSGAKDTGSNNLVIEKSGNNVELGKDNVKSAEVVKAGGVVNGTKKLEEISPTNKAGNDTILKGVEEKVIAIGESVKNKTLEKLVNFGVIKKREYEKLVYDRTRWSLNLSIEDIGNIMKDTEYFQKKQNLTEMEYQPLMLPKSNSTEASPNITAGKSNLGYCECMDLACTCCVRVFNKMMRLNSTACAIITFSSKSQELQYEFKVNTKPYFERKIAAEFPPKICLESAGKAAGICTLFSNVTAKVNIANEAHKIHLSGCMEFDLTLYNRTISAFPVGCFKIPGTATVEKDENNAQNMGNFMP